MFACVTAISYIPHDYYGTYLGPSAVQEGKERGGASVETASRLLGVFFPHHPPPHVRMLFPVLVKPQKQGMA
jgi:hypothetical protein